MLITSSIPSLTRWTARVYLQVAQSSYDLYVRGDIRYPWQPVRKCHCFWAIRDGGRRHCRKGLSRTWLGCHELDLRMYTARVMEKRRDTVQQSVSVHQGVYVIGDNRHRFRSISRCIFWECTYTMRYRLPLSFLLTWYHNRARFTG